MRIRILKSSIPIVISLVFLFGCSPKTTPPAPDMAAGVYLQSGYELFHWSEGLNIMIWHDGVASSACASSGSTGKVAHIVQCHAISRESHHFDWRIETDDGIAAIVTIDDAAFDLESGNVFIISTAGGGTHVRQFQRDLSNIKPQSDSILEFSLMDVELQEFIQATSSD